MKISRLVKCVAFVFVFLIYTQVCLAQNYSGDRLSLDKGWRFNLGDIPFPIIKGHGMSYLDKKLIYTKATAAKEDINIIFPAGNGERELSILIETGKNTMAGLGGLVVVKTKD